MTLPHCSKPATSCKPWSNHVQPYVYTSCDKGYGGWTTRKDRLSTSGSITFRSPWRSESIQVAVCWCGNMPKNWSCWLGHHQSLGTIWEQYWRLEIKEMRTFGKTSRKSILKVSICFWTTVLTFQSISSLLSFTCGLPSAPVAFWWSRTCTASTLKWILEGYSRWQECCDWSVKSAGSTNNKRSTLSKIESSSKNIKIGDLVHPQTIRMVSIFTLQPCFELWSQLEKMFRVETNR